MKPLTPKEFQKSYGNSIPDVVIETVNDLLRKEASYEGKRFIQLRQVDVVDALVAKGIAREAIFTNRYLDFEHEFRKAGWTVTWNKGAYYEPEGTSHWVFKF